MTNFCYLMVLLLCTIGVSNGDGNCRALNGRCGVRNVTCELKFGEGWESVGKCCHQRPCCKNSAVYDPQVVIQYSCGFEVGESCIFKNVDGSTYEWTRAIDSTPSTSEDIRPDIAAKGKYYIYTDQDGMTTSIAKLTTEASDLQASSLCLSFQYFLTYSITSLDVKAGNKDSALTSIWSKSGDEGPFIWKSASIDIPYLGKPVITIEGEIFENAQAVIAIDEISLITGPCPGKK